MIRNLLSRKLRRQRGQGMTEYIVIVGLVAIVLIAAVRSYGQEIRVIIEGSDGNGGMVSETNSVTNGIQPGGEMEEEEDDE